MPYGVEAQRHPIVNRTPFHGQLRRKAIRRRYGYTGTGVTDPLVRISGYARDHQRQVGKTMDAGSTATRRTCRGLVAPPRGCRRARAGARV